MEWNWQQKDWPQFSYDKDQINGLENRMIYGAGLLFGAFQHLSSEGQDQLKIEIISNEALKTSEIEGEYLNRDSLQSSILKQFGLKTDNRKINPAEKAISELMVDLYNNYEAKLSHDLLYSWHKILMKPRSDIVDIGCYRKSDEPMQIISGPIHDPKIHFEAPPASKLMQEMEQFIDWFNDTAPNCSDTLSCLTRAAIAHLYFESIHPFEDGNGRIGRAIAEKAIAQSLGQPSLITLSTLIEKDKKAYYRELETASHTTEITNWINYFAKVILEAQAYTQNRIEFLIKKAKFYGQYKEYLNERQEKVIARLFAEGPEGFKGGLSAKNYLSITGTSRPTATRDLHELATNNILTKSGDRKNTRYYLNI